MVRNVAWIVFVSTLAVLTVGASVPPNLDLTLQAQRDLVAERPYDAEVYNDLGNLLTLDGQDEEAEAAYRRAIELAPEDTLARFNLGVLLQQTGQPRAALDELKAVLEIDGRHARAHYQIGTLYEARRQRNKALSHYAQAFAYDTELTFAEKNPHLIDNQLATEAMLMSARYAAASSSETARLYGEPERIADLMLRKSSPEAPAPEEVAGESTPPETRRHPQRDPEDEDDDGGADDDDDDDDTGRGGRDGRRTLTSEDLDTGSTVGRAQRVGSSPTSNRRRRPAIGTGRSNTGRSNTGRPNTGRPSSGRPAVGADGRTQRTPPQRLKPPPSSTKVRPGRPQYIPPSGASTGRLELELLPLQSAPAERLADGNAGSANGQTLNRM